MGSKPKVRQRILEQLRARPDGTVDGRYLADIWHKLKLSEEVSKTQFNMAVGSLAHNTDRGLPIIWRRHPEDGRRWNQLSLRD